MRTNSHKHTLLNSCEDFSIMSNVLFSSLKKIQKLNQAFNTIPNLASEKNKKQETEIYIYSKFKKMIIIYYKKCIFKSN